MRRLGIALCLPLLAASLEAAGPQTAHAAAADPGAVECTATGSLTTNAGIVPDSVTFTAILTLNCAGVLDDSAPWQLTMSGQMSPGFCGGGEGLASVGGSGPDGTVNGNLQLTQTGSHIQMEGGWSDNDPAGEEVQIGVEATPTSGVPCVTPSTAENLTGHASIVDQAPPPDFVLCTYSGVETYSPAIPLIASTYNIQTGNASMNCVNPVSDDAGGWTFAYAGPVNGNCGETNGILDLSGGSSPEGSVGGSFDYERVGTLFLFVGTLTTGTSDSHTFEAFGAMAPNAVGACATNPWTSSALSADASMAEAS